MHVNFRGLLLQTPPTTLAPLVSLPWPSLFGRRGFEDLIKPGEAAAIGQSGYKAVDYRDLALCLMQVEGTTYWQKYFEAMKPPWRGRMSGFCLATKGSLVVIGLEA